MRDLTYSIIIQEEISNEEYSSTSERLKKA
jgi:hypothetical protein